MSDNFVDFRAVKQLVSITALLDHYHIQLRRVNQHSLRGRCPLPTHSSEHSTESFGVNLDRNIWACQSTSCAAARQGKKGGNVLDFVAVMERCSVRDAALKLNEWFVSGGQVTAHVRTATDSNKRETQLVAERKDEVGNGEVNKPLTFALSKIDHTHSYLRERGITEEIAREFGVGYFAGRGTMSNRIVIPIHNERGELVAYAGRAVDGSEPKYKLPAGFRKSLEIFNLHRVGECERVVVVEGFFDCIKVSAAGFPCVALMGSSLSEFQEQVLARFKYVTIMLDGDEAGRSTAPEIAARLARRCFVRIIDVGEGRQPDQLSPEDIRVLVR